MLKLFVQFCKRGGNAYKMYMTTFERTVHQLRVQSPFLPMLYIKSTALLKSSDARYIFYK